MIEIWQATYPTLGFLLACLAIWAICKWPRGIENPFKTLHAWLGRPRGHERSKAAYKQMTQEQEWERGKQVTFMEPEPAHVAKNLSRRTGLPWLNEPRMIANMRRD